MQTSKSIRTDDPSHRGGLLSSVHPHHITRCGLIFQSPCVSSDQSESSSSGVKNSVIDCMILLQFHARNVANNSLLIGCRPTKICDFHLVQRSGHTDARICLIYGFYDGFLNEKLACCKRTISKFCLCVHSNSFQTKQAIFDT